jgi:hypothetical protein
MLLKPHGMHWQKKKTNLLDAYGLKNNTKTYVKDKGSKLNMMTTAFKFAVKCETLGFRKNF